MDLIAQMQGDGGMGGGPMVMMILMAALAVLLIAGLIWLVRRLSAGRRDDSAGAGDPLQVLDRRFARGEIDTDEYRERRAALGGRR